MDSLQSASDLLNRRGSATFQMVQATEDPVTVDVSKARENFLSGSAHVLLNVIDHCYDPVKDARSKADKTSDHAPRKKLIDEAHLVLSHIYYIDDALRCVILADRVRTPGD
jgi:hypothetical protein